MIIKLSYCIILKYRNNSCIIWCLKTIYIYVLLNIDVDILYYHININNYFGLSVVNIIPTQFLGSKLST